MCREKKDRYPTVLSIAGSDSSGGAGIQADIKTIAANGCYAAAIITAITAQNTRGVHLSVPVSPHLLKAQIDTVMTDLTVDAVKIGMIGNRENLQIIIEALRTYRPKHVVYDPVMVATSGHSLMEQGLTDIICKELMPLVEFVTPNIPEAEKLIGMKVETLDDMSQAASLLQQTGVANVYLKGGHFARQVGTDLCRLQPFTENRHSHRPAPDSLHVDAAAACCHELIMSLPAVETTNTHGTGCTLSSCLAARLALGESPRQAAIRAKEYIHRAITYGSDIQTGHGHGPLCHFHPTGNLPLISPEGGVHIACIPTENDLWSLPNAYIEER